jgi:hypothetical protein
MRSQVCFRRRREFVGAASDESLPISTETSRARPVVRRGPRTADARCVASGSLSSSGSGPPLSRWFFAFGRGRFPPIHSAKTHGIERKQTTAARQRTTTKKATQAALCFTVGTLFTFAFVVQVSSCSSQETRCC